MLFTYETREYNHFGRMRLFSRVFAIDVKLKKIAAPFTLNLMTY